MASIQSSTDPRIAQPAMSLRDRLAGYLQSATSYLPASMQSYPDIPQMGVKEGTLAKDLMTPAENVPVLGQGLAAEDVGAARQRGDWLGMGVAALGLMPGGGAEKHAAKEAVEAGRDTLARIKAYHGSPHDFDKFDISKIGTGEGAQVYGHGLYFAENEGVAKSYQDALKKHTDDFYHGDQRLSGDEELAASVLMGSLDKQAAIDWLKGHGQDRFVPLVEKMDKNLLRKEKPPQGSLYEVDINADPEHFLDYDKPLSEQPHIRSKLDDVIRWQNVPLKNNVGADTTGSQLLDYLERKGGKPFATEELRDAGIPGIKYFDQGSRATAAGELLGVEKTPQGWQAKVKVDNRTGVGLQAPAQMFTTSKPYATEAEARKWAEDKIGGGSRNYVVFDDKLISIVKKNGIAAALAAGLITESQAAEMRQQGYDE